MDKTPEELADAAAAVDAAAAEAQAKADAAKLPGKKVKVRVLVACSHGRPNDVVLVDAATARQGEADNQLDASKAAVAYAEALKGPQP